MIAASSFVVSTVTASFADLIAASAASFTAFDVRVAPLTESQPLIVSSVAAFPTSIFWIPFDFETAFAK